MIEIHKETVGEIPLLHVVKSVHKNEKMPFIIFVHGFTSAKEHNLHYAYLLAEKGFRVILPDADLHGEREREVTREERMMEFWNIVIKTINELELLKNAFAEKELIQLDKIGIVGTSMGGMITLGSLTQYSWIKVAVSLMGTPSFEQFARQLIAKVRQEGIEIPYSDDELEHYFTQLRNYDLSQKPDLLNERPLLFWHGKQDPVVPFQPTYKFYKQLTSNEKYKDVVEFIADPMAGHKVTRQGLLKTVEWFERHLLKDDYS